jgi:hypothetical protein
MFGGWEEPLTPGKQHTAGKQHKSQEDESAMLRTIHGSSRAEIRDLRGQNAPIRRASQSGAAIGLVVCMLLAGCSGERAVATTERTHVVYVVQRSWHTGIALSAAEWPRPSSFVDARYLEFGWGDAAYYQADEPTSGMALGSLWPGPTVMEVVPLQEIPASPEHDYYSVALHVTRAELEAMTASIDQSFVQPLSPTGKTYRVAAGEARYYHARGKFHAFRTCNRWTSEVLRLAGCAVKPATMMTAGQVMKAAKRCDAESPSRDH